MSTSDPILYPLPRGSVTSLQQDLARARTDLSDTLAELSARFDPHAVAQRSARRAARTVAPPMAAAAAALIVRVATSRLRRRGLGYRLAAATAAGATAVITARLTRLLIVVGNRRVASEGHATVASARVKLPASPDGGDVVDVLLAQHRRIDAMFDRVAHADPGDPRREAFAALVKMLGAHEHAEQQIVHPALVEAGDGAEVVEARTAEEQAAERAIASLISRGPDDSKFPQQLNEVAAMVRAHAEREETLEFPLVRSRVSAQRLQSLATQVNAAQADGC